MKPKFRRINQYGAFLTTEKISVTFKEAQAACDRSLSLLISFLTYSFDSINHTIRNYRLTAMALK